MIWRIGVLGEEGDQRYGMGRQIEQSSGHERGYESPGDEFSGHGGRVTTRRPLWLAGLLGDANKLMGSCFECCLLLFPLRIDLK